MQCFGSGRYTCVSNTGKKSEFKDAKIIPKNNTLKKGKLSNLRFSAMKDHSVMFN